MKIAIVHDWLYTYAGAEKVLEQLILCYPEADIYSLIDFLPPHERGFLQGKPVTTSFIQKLPWAKKRHRHYLPLMPLAIEQFDLAQYDLVISSSHAVAKGVITSPHTLHICYCHSPMRYAWDMQGQYLVEAGLTRGLKSWITRYLLHRMRLWDYRTANGVDVFVANSEFIARRIMKIYRRSSEVIYPGVALEKFQYSPDKEDYFFTASRLVPYKKISLIAEAFAHMPEYKLIIAGSGPEQAKIEAIAAKSGNITFVGYVDDQRLASLMQRARAFVFAAEEDFGIIPVEAQAAGTPVIAFGRGGSLETVRGLANIAPTGVFFNAQSVAAICAAVRQFMDSPQISSQNCRENALRFANECFRQQFRQLAAWKYREFNERLYV